MDMDPCTFVSRISLRASTYYTYYALCTACRYSYWGGGGSSQFMLLALWGTQGSGDRTGVSALTRRPLTAHGDTGPGGDSDARQRRRMRDGRWRSRHAGRRGVGRDAHGRCRSHSQDPTALRSRAA